MHLFPPKSPCQKALQVSWLRNSRSAASSTKSCIELRGSEVWAGSGGLPWPIGEEPKIAREAKAIAPSACYWASNGSGPTEIYYVPITNSAVRVPDPIFSVLDSWIVRRLAPDCSRIELADLPEARDEYKLLYSMGYETGNIHLGLQSAQASILHDLERLPKKWLHESAKRMRKLVVSDWKAWRKSQN